MRVARLAASSMLLAWAAVGADVHGQGSVAGDRAALAALYEATGGPNWHVDTNWLSGEPLSAWAGVTVDDGGRVAWLELGGNNLRGSLPAELGDLTRLAGLDLLFNQLTGSIPAELGNLASVWRLDLQENRLTGAIPSSLGNLPALEVLILANNELTGSIPASLARPPGLWSLVLSNNDLTGPIPDAFGGMPNIRFLSFGANSLSGELPASLGDLRTLEWLQVGFNAGLTGELPAGLARPPVNVVDIHGTGICVPGTHRFRTWAAGIRFESSGRTCDVTPPDVPVIDLAVFYTPTAREAAGGTSSIEAVIDLMVAETNRAYVDSGVRQRVALVAREETPYRESGSSIVDLERLTNPADGHLDGVHPIRDIVGADLVHLIVERASVLGVAHLAPRAAGAFGLTCRRCGGLTFAHELGHNMGLGHDRHTACGGGGSCVWAPHYPYAFGYVNDRAFEPAPPPSAGWYTIMAYASRCGEAGIDCRPLALFSDPGRTQDGDPTGAAGERDAAGVRGPADAVRALNETRHSVASFRPSVPRRGRRGPVPVGRLPDRTLQVGGAAVVVDVSGAFRDPEGGALSYRALSSVASAVEVEAAGSRVTISPVSEGLSTVTVIATGDAGAGASAWQQFAVVVDPAGARDYDTDDDGLIEIRTLAQLDAVRHDPNGAGDPLSPSGRSAYDTAFPGRSRTMGCGRGSCRGYELLADLDLDTNRSGGPDAGDAWWNGGAGWAPIGTRVEEQFAAVLEGNGHAIRNLFIARRDADAGLFARIGPSAVVRRLRLVDVDVTGVNAGGLAAENHGFVVASHASGRVTASGTAGGLVGSSSDRIVDSWAACSVSGSNWAGGLTGWNIRDVVSSYATGDVRGSAAGGLVGNNSGTIAASYATGSVRGSATAGGLVARNGAGASILASYAAAPVSGNAASAGGLVGMGDPMAGRVESSYWDVGVSGQANSNGGSGRSTGSMQAPTGYDGIYRNWNRDLDGDGAADDPWDFGTTAEYPALKADVDGDGRSTWPEFGDQRGRGGDPDPPPGEPPAGNCVPDPETFCFQNSRFAVEMDWWTSDGKSGPGKAAPDGANDSGMFWFFDPNNREVLIKVLNGCAVNDHVWVYGASATDLGYSIRVTDTMTGVVSEYRKEDGRAADAITDSRAFPDVCAALPPAAPRSRP